MTIETNTDGQPPAVVKLPQIGVYVGGSDVPAPSAVHLYLRADRPDGEVIYQYHRSIELQ